MKAGVYVCTGVVESLTQAALIQKKKNLGKFWDVKNNASAEK